MTASPVRATAPHPTLVRAVKALTDHCDGAVLLDGVGWNGVDTFLGHVLAKVPPEQWDRKMVYWAWYATQKYKRQLAAYGIAWDEIPPVPLVERPTDWYRERKERYQAQREQDEREARVDRDYQEYQRNKERQGRARQAQGRMVLPLDPTTVMIKFPYDPDFKERVKRHVVGIRWDQENKRWHAAITVESAPSILALGGDEFMFGFGPGVIDRIREIVGMAATMKVASKAASTSFRFDGLLREPYPFQWAGIEYAVKAERTFIADAMGLGKSLQSIAASYYLKARHTLVICPANVKFNWKREIEMTLPDQIVCVIEGMKPWPIYPEAEWYVINHNITSAHLAILCQQVAIDCLIVDEGHYLTNPKVARTKAVQAICDAIPYRFILTGTPVLNRPLELLPQLKILGRLKDVAKTEWDFKQKYCAGRKDAWGKWDFKGASNEIALNERMRATCYVRREKADVLLELPPKRRVVLDVPIVNRREYERAEADLVTWLADRAANDRAFHASIAHLTPQERQQAIARRREESVSKTTAAEALVRFNALKRLAAQGKIDSAKEWIADFLASGEKLVVGAWYRETVLELCKALEPLHGKPVPHIMGGDASLDRQKTVDQFQNDPDTRLLVCNILAAGEGITLTAASNSLTVELGWNPGRHEQFEDREHRIGQRDSVTAWYMIAVDTIEGDVYDIISAKRVVTTAVNEGRDLPDAEINVTREVAARLRKRHQAQQIEMPLPTTIDDSPPWDE